MNPRAAQLDVEPPISLSPGHDEMRHRRQKRLRQIDLERALRGVRGGGCVPAEVLLLPTGEIRILLGERAQGGDDEAKRQVQAHFAARR